MWSKEPNEIIREENAEAEIVIYCVQGDREEQQDTFGCLLSDNKLICVVADGMGGLENGRSASESTVKMILSAFRSEEEMQIEQELMEPIRAADNQLANEKKDSNSNRGAGSTVVAVILQNGMLRWASVGDSRAYLFREGKYVQLTKDQNYKTYLDESLRAKRITPEEYSEMMDQQDALINYIGMGMLQDSGFIDSNSESLMLQSGDTILVMSDGVYRIMPEEEINRMICNVPDIVNLAQTMEMWMVSKSKTKGQERDNTTLAVIRIK